MIPLQFACIGAHLSCFCFRKNPKICRLKNIVAFIWCACLRISLFLSPLSFTSTSIVPFSSSFVVFFYITFFLIFIHPLLTRQDGTFGEERLVQGPSQHTLPTPFVLFTLKHKKSVFTYNKMTS